MFVLMCACVDRYVCVSYSYNGGDALQLGRQQRAVEEIGPLPATLKLH